MAKRRLAMMSCEDSHSTPWQRCTGEESQLVIKGLGQGSVIILIITVGSDELTVMHNADGVYPWPNLKAQKYKVEKKLQGEKSPTTVEIGLNANRFQD